MAGRARRVLAEARRHLRRSGTLRILLGVAAFASLLAWLGQGQGAIDVPLLFTYYILPLLMCPYAAHRVLADRGEGIHAVLVTTPLSRREVLTAKVLAVLLVPALAVAVTLPLLWALGSATAPGAFWSLLDHGAWALALGWASASAGLVIGHLTPRRPRAGLAAAFATVPLWFIAGVSLNDDPDPSLPVEVLAKVSPVTYWDSMWVTYPIPTGPAELLLGPLLLCAFGLAVLVPIALGLQDADGWSRPLGRHPLALAALAGVLALALGTLAVWELPEDDTTVDYSFPIKADRAGLYWSVFPQLEGFPPPPAWGPETRAQVRVDVYGPPNGTVHLEGLEVTSEKIDFEPLEASDRLLVLDNVFEDEGEIWNETGGAVGHNETTINLTARPTSLFAYAPARLGFEANGEPVSFEIGYSGLDWEMDAGAIGGAAAATLVPVAAAAWRLPSRWNRW